MGDDDDDGWNGSGRWMMMMGGMAVKDGRWVMMMGGMAVEDG